jgi:hypothetical protein
MGNRNRTAGHNWERQCVNLLKRFFPNIITSRSESKSRDDQKVDLMNRNEFKNGKIPFDFQCKTTSSNINYVRLLDEMPDDNNPIILHKYTRKAEKNFIEGGKYVIMKLDTFEKLLSEIYEEYKK